MALRIDTFDNLRGGNVLYKALTHPCSAAVTRELLVSLAERGPIAIFDPIRAVDALDAIFGLNRLEIAGVYVQDVARIGASILGQPAAPITELPRTGARAVLI